MGRTTIPDSVPPVTSAALAGPTTRAVLVTMTASTEAKRRTGFGTRSIVAFRGDAAAAALGALGRRWVRGDVPDDRPSRAGVESTELDADATQRAVAKGARDRDVDVDRLGNAGKIELQMNVVATGEGDVADETSTDGREIDDVGRSRDAVAGARHQCADAGGHT